MRVFLLMAWFFMSQWAAAAEPRPFTDAEETRTLPEAETRVWSQAKEMDEAIASDGYLDDDEALLRYLHRVVARLYPEFKDQIAVRVYKDPALNAFALPNGSIYLHTGILARLENEAQLATLLSHEITHFTHRHGYLGHTQQKSSLAWAAGIRALGIPGIGNLAALSSIYGFSRELETEADNLGFERLLSAGYDPTESVKVFELLAADAEKQQSRAPYFFSTHPRLQERIANYQRLIAKGDGRGDVGRDAFLQATRALRMAFLQDAIATGNDQPVIWLLENEIRRSLFPPQAQYFLGEAYRLRNQPTDAALAEQHFQEVARGLPDYAPPVRALGLICMRKRDYDCVIQRLGWYLELAPDAADAAYMRQYLQQAKEKRDASALLRKNSDL